MLYLYAVILRVSSDGSCGDSHESLVRCFLSMYAGGSHCARATSPDYNRIAPAANNKVVEPNSSVIVASLNGLTAAAEEPAYDRISIS